MINEADEVGIDCVPDKVLCHGLMSLPEICICSFEPSVVMAGIGRLREWKASELDGKQNNTKGEDIGLNSVIRYDGVSSKV